MPSRLSANTVQPASLPIGVLLEKRAPFTIPRYQRPYAWDGDNIEDFIADIKDLLEHPTQRSRDHFFGSMVAVSEQDASQAEVLSHEVVDGQQRLTTFCLLLAQIVHAARRLARHYRNVGEAVIARRFDTLAKETQDKYLYYDVYDLKAGVTNRALRLRLGEADDAKYQALLNGTNFTDARDSHRRLQIAWDMIGKAFVAPIEQDHTSSGEKRLNHLTAVRDAILKEAFVIHVVTTDRQGGYRLFSVLNDRGARLTVTDLLRSRTLEQLTSFPIIQTQAAKEWDAILVKSGAEVDDFLRAYYPSLTGRRAGRDALFDAFVELLFKKTPHDHASATKVVDELVRMEEAFRAYTSIRRGIWPYPISESQVTAWQRDRLQRLTVLLKHELVLPLLLALYSAADEKDFADVVHKIELFAFRYKNICDGHAGAPANAYYRAAKNARDGVHGWKSTLISELHELLVGRAWDTLFKESLKNLLNYDTPSQRANIRELLTTLEDYWGWLRNPSGSPKYQGSAVIDVEHVDIEHIYPQNPLPSELDTELEPRRGALGNLTFWDPHDNKDAGNASFARKKALYRNSRIRMTQVLADLGEWNVTKLTQREDLLLKYACKIFMI